ncbi:MAG: S8 family serine peptidase [Chloroflexaceae bacterium]|nr:S8 family serine peptidase [Chloroflexaceae bacterium]
MLQHLCRLTVIAVFVASLLGAAPSANAGGASQYVPGELIVSLTDDAVLPAITATFNLDPVPLERFGQNPIYRLRILSNEKPDRLARMIARDPRVDFAEPNYINSVPSGTQRSLWAKAMGEGDYTAQWAGTMIGLSNAHQVTRGAGVTVAVLDTGIDPGHPLFAGRLVPGYDFVDLDNDPREIATGDPGALYGHGTHVAGLIALVAPEARIMPIRVLNEYGMGNVWVLARALAFAVDPDGNPLTNDGADVINLSLATLQKTKMLQEVVSALNCSPDEAEALAAIASEGTESKKKLKLPRCDRGVIVVAAAGNTADETLSFPAAEAVKVKGVLAVAASTQDDSLAAFSSRGGWVKIMAPGEQIVSSLPGGAYGAWSGTSMATPLVAGSAALVRAIQPDLKADRIVIHLIRTATKIRGPAPNRLNAAAAVLNRP